MENERGERWRERKVKGEGWKEREGAREGVIDVYVVVKDLSCYTVGLRMREREEKNEK